MTKEKHHHCQTVSMVEEEGGALGLEEKAELSPEKPAVKKWVARPLTTVKDIHLSRSLLDPE